ncbi:hypothetical protein [Mucilaginibacter sp. dw_454]|uniref:hypothetical protein n=1 Tax=Mucilaginibacter sp. dw_454 TaxID=2720079 RepID=UPI001BD3AC42|nr:hypothetical protein [Mucilaginibacter sp. dw_454]
MDQNKLVKQISATLGKLKVIELSRILRDQQFNLRDLIDITHYQDEAIAFRAAWILENLFLQQPEVYASYLEYLFNALTDIKWPPVKRHYAKIVMHITSPKAPKIIKDQLKQIHIEPVIEQLFEWLIDPKIKIAVKVFSAEALFNLRNQHDLIKDELRNQIEFLMRDGSAAIQTRGKKLLKGLG